MSASPATAHATPIPAFAPVPRPLLPELMPSCSTDEEDADEVADRVETVWEVAIETVEEATVPWLAGALVDVWLLVELLPEISEESARDHCSGDTAVNVVDVTVPLQPGAFPQHAHSSSSSSYSINVV